MPTITAVRKNKSHNGAKEKKVPLHRVGSLVHDKILDKPKTIGQRMTARRMQLHMTQEAVAEKVVFTPKTGSRMNDEVVLSRNAYCMYETDSSEPSIDKIEAIAKVLKVTPNWLAFGQGAREKVEASKFHPKKKSFQQSAHWIIPEEWLAQNFGVAPTEIEFFNVTEYSGDFAPGNVAIVRRGMEPTNAVDLFLFKHNGKPRIALISRPAKGAPIRLFSDDKSSHSEISRIKIFGKVVGKIGSLTKH